MTLICLSGNDSQADCVVGSFLAPFAEFADVAKSLAGTAIGTWRVDEPLTESESADSIIRVMIFQWRTKRQLPAWLCLKSVSGSRVSREPYRSVER